MSRAFRSLPQSGLPSAEMMRPCCSSPRVLTPRDCSCPVVEALGFGMRVADETSMPGAPMGYGRCNHRFTRHVQDSRLEIAHGAAVSAPSKPSRCPSTRCKRCRNAHQRRRNDFNDYPPLPHPSPLHVHRLAARASLRRVQPRRNAGARNERGAASGRRQPGGSSGCRTRGAA